MRVIHWGDAIQTRPGKKCDRARDVDRKQRRLRDCDVDDVGDDDFKLKKKELNEVTLMVWRLLHGLWCISRTIHICASIASVRCG